MTGRLSCQGSSSSGETFPNGCRDLRGKSCRFLNPRTEPGWIPSKPKRVPPTSSRRSSRVALVAPAWESAACKSTQGPQSSSSGKPSNTPLGLPLDSLQKRQANRQDFEVTLIQPKLKCGCDPSHRNSDLFCFSVRDSLCHRPEVDALESLSPEAFGRFRREYRVSQASYPASSCVSRNLASLSSAVLS